jgi:peptidoglycan hydrolase-like protein with peptidoglycan-binding domain
MREVGWGHGRGTRACVAVGAAVALICAACGSSGKGSTTTTDAVSAAQARVTSAQTEVTNAQSGYNKAKATFCSDAQSYITALDRYAKTFTNATATVGDVKTNGADLQKPQANVNSSADAATAAGSTLAKANADLAAAEADLAAAKAAASSLTTAPTTTTSTTAPPVSTATVQRVKQAQSDLNAAFQGVTDQTPLQQATTQVNSAAVALQMSWVQLFNEAGCLTGEAQQKAATAVHDYTVTLQTNLKTAGFYTGEIDGVYGPATADAVKALQKANGLPQTGWVDQATAAALDAAVAAKGGAAANQAALEAAGLQSVLKVAGYWTGPVDGKWTPELTAALKKFQTDLGVPATGEVDAATLAALEEAVATGKAALATTTTAAGATTTTTATTSTS